MTKNLKIIYILLKIFINKYPNKKPITKTKNAQKKILK